MIMSSKQIETSFLTQEQAEQGDNHSTHTEDSDETPPPPAPLPLVGGIRSLGISLTDDEILALTRRTSEIDAIDDNFDIDNYEDDDSIVFIEEREIQEDEGDDDDDDILLKQMIQNDHEQLRNATVRSLPIAADHNDTKVGAAHRYASMPYHSERQKQSDDDEYDSKLPARKQLADTSPSDLQMIDKSKSTAFIGRETNTTNKQNLQHGEQSIEDLKPAARTQQQIPTAAAAAVAKGPAPAATQTTLRESNSTSFPPYTSSIKRRDVSTCSDASELLSSPGAINIRGSQITSRFLPYEAEESEEFTTARQSSINRNLSKSNDSTSNVLGGKNGSKLQLAVAVESELASEYETAKQERDTLREQLREIEDSYERRIREMEDFRHTAAAYAIQVVPVIDEIIENGSTAATADRDNDDDNYSCRSSSSFFQASAQEVSSMWKTPYVRKAMLICFSILIIPILVMTVVLVRRKIDDDNNIGNNPGNNETSTNMFYPTRPMLPLVKERGFIRCRASDINVKRGEGFTLDLCYAVAAAIFDDPSGAKNRSEFVPNIQFGGQFASVYNGTIDLSTSLTTLNMRRNLYEPSTGLGMAFSVPFFFSGMRLSGIPFFVDCADRLDSLIGDCRRLSVCALAETVTLDLVRTLLPGSTTHAITRTYDLFVNFANGTCNVIAYDYFELDDENLHEVGYDGEYTYGTKLHSNEPLSLTTRADDQEWADFCSWVVQALITAEALNITQETALSDSLWSLATSSFGDVFPETTTVFGEEYKDMFRNAIAAVGNYGEMYERHSKFLVPRLRGRINLLNFGDSGLLYASPFGDLIVKESPLPSSLPPPKPVPNGTLESIVDRGFLRCGVMGNRAGFAFLQVEKKNGIRTTQWTGLDIEFCRAISAAIFIPEKDLWNHEDDNIVFVDVGSNVDNGYIALDQDEIDVFAGGIMTLTTDIKDGITRRGFTFSPRYFYYDNEGDLIGNIVRSDMKGIGLSLVTCERDPQWSAFVGWITTAIIYAEHQEITQDMASDMPIVGLFGQKYVQMFRDAISTVGNYGELFNQTLSHPFNISRSGRNFLNLKGTAQMVALPFF